MTAQDPAKLSWTSERVEMLTKLWSDGLSASQIAGRLGGVTRNAVIGKVHRLGLSGRSTQPRTSAPRPRRPRQSPPTPKPASYPTAGATALKMEPHTPRPRPVAEPEPEPLRLVGRAEGERVTILMLSDKTCRWPQGDPSSEDFCFCGHTPRQGMPYCDYHARLAYQPAHERRRQRQAAG